MNTGTVWAAVQLVARPQVGPARSGPGRVGVVTCRRRRQLVPVTMPRGGRRSTTGGGCGYRMELARRAACDQTRPDRAGGAASATRWRPPSTGQPCAARPIWLQRSALEADLL